MEYSEEIQIILHEPDVKLKNRVLVSGFHSALGETGYIVLRHLAGQEQARRAQGSLLQVHRQGGTAHVLQE